MQPEAVMEITGDVASADATSEPNPASQPTAHNNSTMEFTFDNILPTSDSIPHTTQKSELNAASQDFFPFACSDPVTSCLYSPPYDPIFHSLPNFVPTQSYHHNCMIRPELSGLEISK
jgi:hypothetical protein